MTNSSSVVQLAERAAAEANLPRDGENDELIRNLPLSYLLVPSPLISYSYSADRLVQAIEDSMEMFVRGGAVHLMKDGVLSLADPKAFVSYSEKFGQICEYRELRHGRRLSTALMNEGHARILLACDAMKELPSLETIIDVPLLIDNFSGGLVALKPGYNDVQDGIWVKHDLRVPLMPLDKAVTLIKRLVSDFRWAEAADESRAIAALLTPAFQLTRLVRPPYPIHIFQANKSQAGKNYLSMAISLLYGGSMSMVVNKSDKGGVGSFGENLSQGMEKGNPFLCISNFRGRLDSQLLETGITEGEAQCRLPHKGVFDAIFWNTVFHLTSNGLELTPDLANRSNIVEIVKRGGVVKWEKWSEGGLHQHIAANRALYMGAIHSIVLEWHSRGGPMNEISHDEHSFRHWAGAMDWIVQKLFGLPYIFQGHEERKKDSVSVDRKWVRDLCLVSPMDTPLMASEIYSLCVENSIVFWNSGTAPAETLGVQVIGTRMKSLFSKEEEVDGITLVRVGGFCVVRRSVSIRNETTRNIATRHFYLISKNELTADEIAGHTTLMMPRLTGVPKDEKY